MARRTFLHRSETFGFDTSSPWALDAFRLLFAVPRAYEPLTGAWDVRYPGTSRALARLAEMEFVEHQPGVIIDTRTGKTATRPTRRVARYRTTARGRRLAADVAEDLRVLEDTFAHLTPDNAAGVGRLIDVFDLSGSHAAYGLSAAHAAQLSDLPERTVRWWVARLTDQGLLRRLEEDLADVREVIPAHWRVTRMLCRQLTDVIDAFDDASDHLKVEFRLSRSRFLDDIDPARVGISGATDFDHDIETQRILAAMMSSPRCSTDGVFAVEPRLLLPLNKTVEPWQFDPDASPTLFYQPDAEMREQQDRRVWRSVVEYERYQTRRDAWNHIERFLGWLHTRALPFEAAVLRFVVDSEPRVRSYVRLIEAFADHTLDNPQLLPANQVRLAVSSAPRLLAADDPLDDSCWFRIDLPASGNGAVPILHPKDDSPYDDYFSRVTSS